MDVNNLDDSGYLNEINLNLRKFKYIKQLKVTLKS